MRPASRRQESATHILEAHGLRAKPDASRLSRRPSSLHPRPSKTTLPHRSPAPPFTTHTATNPTHTVHSRDPPPYQSPPLHPAHERRSANKPARMRSSRGGGRGGARGGGNTNASRNDDGAPRGPGKPNASRNEDGAPRDPRLARRGGQPFVPRGGRPGATSGQQARERNQKSDGGRRQRPTRSMSAEQEMRESSMSGDAEEEEGLFYREQVPSTYSTPAREGPTIRQRFDRVRCFVLSSTPTSPTNGFRPI